jgi:hypothetical protein
MSTNDVVGPPDRVLVVFHHEQCIAVAGELAQCAPVGKQLLRVVGGTGGEIRIELPFPE